MFPPVIQTARLLLRAPRIADAEDIHRGYAQDAEVCRYLTWMPNQSLAQTQEFLLTRLREMADGAAMPWGITMRDDNTLKGMIELRLHAQRRKCSIGYVLARAHWGQGMMTEALCAVVEFALRMPQMYRVDGVCDFENLASARVMEKAGMVYEGVLRRFAWHPNVSDEPRDVRMYARTR